MNLDVVFERENEVKELADCINTPEIKVVIGLRRAGKSYLLKDLFTKYLKANLKYLDSEIVIYDLDSSEYTSIRDLDSFKKMLDKTNDGVKVIIIDEVQKAGDGYEELLVDFNNLHKNIDLYITGSNSKSPSNDILRKFKEHAKRISLKPITFGQIKQAMPDFTIEDYFKYGSLPIVLKKNSDERVKYLGELYEETYISDIKDRCHFQYLSNENMKHIVDNILSNLENPISTYNIFKNVLPKGTRSDEVKSCYKKEVCDFVEACVDSFLLVNFEDGKIENENIPPEYRDKNIKKYCFDIGLFNVISKSASFYRKNSCRIENLVFLELVARNIKPIGKTIITLDGSEKPIDFYFKTDGVETFIQVEHTLNDDCYEREIGNLTFAPADARKINVYAVNTSQENIPSDVKNIIIDDFLFDF